MTDPNFTPAEYRAQVEIMRRTFRGEPNYAEWSFVADLVGGMLMAAADRIEAMQRIIADDAHKTEFWQLWCNVYDGPVAWDGRTAFQQIQYLQAILDGGAAPW